MNTKVLLVLAMLAFSGCASAPVGEDRIPPREFPAQQEVVKSEMSGQKKALSIVSAFLKGMGDGLANRRTVQCVSHQYGDRIETECQ